jgi:hypothetical protein
MLAVRGTRAVRSKPSIVAEHLMKYGTISDGTAVLEYGRFRLSDAIYKLRRSHRHLLPAGKRIVTETRHDAHGQPYGVYRLVGAN